MSEQQARIVSAWDAIAAAYQARYRIGSEDLHLGPMMPGACALGLVNDLTDRSVLEVGCGGAQNLIAAAQRGAGPLVGVDPSAGQLAEARRLAAQHNVDLELHRMGAEDVGRLSRTFDLVISVYALMYVEKINIALTAMAGRVSACGQLIISVDHPLRLAGEWHDEDDSFRVGGYFDRGWQRWPYGFPEQGVSVEMQRFHRTVGDWVSALLATGLTLTALVEPEPAAGPDARFGTHSKHGVESRRNVFHPDRLRRVPGTLVLVAARSEQ